MLNDSVREELASKISPLARAVRTETIKTAATELPIVKPAMPLVAPPIAPPEQAVNNAPVASTPVVSKPSIPAPVMSAPAEIVPSEEKKSVPPAPAPRSITTELTSKPTSPTLVEFHNKNASLPEWRLQLQNSVRMRGERGSRQPDVEAQQPAQATAVSRPQRAALATKGATALQPEYVEKPVEKEEPAYAKNPKLAAAMRRIEASRRQFLAPEQEIAVEAGAPKTFPYVVTSKSPDSTVKAPVAEPAPAFTAKPKFTVTDSSAPRAEKFDTNKLPPLPVSAKIDSYVELTEFEQKASVETISVSTAAISGEKKTFLNCEVIEEVDLFEDSAEETEADDRAPVSLRFNAGLFDLIIGAFSSALLLSPFMLAGGKMFTFEGALAFLATLSIVMFVYLTASIGLMGRTFGMRLFSLEVVDIDENAYPSLHQAAVSSSVYLLSLAFGGVGFLTLFLNDEKRAAHDLLSGTIVVKEY